MKSLLASYGISTDGIRRALVYVQSKPVAESSALCTPTTAYAFSAGAGLARRLISGRAAIPLYELGWKSLGRSAS